MNSRELTHFKESPWIRTRPANITPTGVLTNKKAQTGRKRGRFDFDVILKDRETSQRYSLKLSLTPIKSHFFLPAMFQSPSEFKAAADPLDAYLESLESEHTNSRTITDLAVLDAERLQRMKEEICESLRPEHIGGWTKTQKAAQANFQCPIGNIWIREYEEILED